MVVSFPEKKKAKKFIEEGGESPKKREKEEVVFLDTLHLGIHFRTSYQTEEYIDRLIIIILIVII